MKRAVILLLALAVGSWGAEPLLGKWQLDRQEINGEATASAPLVLTVSQAGDQITFTFSVPVDKSYAASMSYTLKLDGSEADVRNAKQEKVGTIQMTPDGPSQYKITLRAPNRPDSFGRLTVSADKKTLTSEADTVRGGQPSHSRQTFSRQ